MFVSLATHQRGEEQAVKASALSLRFAGSLVLLVSLLFTPGYGQALSQEQQGGLSQEQQKIPLGSLSSVGEVYINDSLAVSESTIYIYHKWKGDAKDLSAKSGGILGKLPVHRRIANRDGCVEFDRWWQWNDHANWSLCPSSLLPSRAVDNVES